MSTSQRAVTPCGWGVKAGMVQLIIEVNVRTMAALALLCTDDAISTSSLD